VFITQVKGMATQQPWQYLIKDELIDDAFPMWKVGL